MPENDLLARQPDWLSAVLAAPVSGVSGAPVSGVSAAAFSGSASDGGTPMAAGKDSTAPSLFPSARRRFSGDNYCRP